jgi:hypothetical protein
MNRFFNHPVITIIVLITFVQFSLVGCERPVTRYTSDGKPYTTQEFSAGETLAGIFLGLLTIGALAACSCVHGSLNNPEVTGVLKGDQFIGNSARFKKNLSVDAIKDKSLINGKPVRIQDKYGKTLSEFIVYGDSPRPNDKILATISPEILFSNEAMIGSQKITDKVKVSLRIESDFALESHHPAIITIKEVEFLEDIPEAFMFHTTVLYQGKNMEFFVDTDICRVE